MCMRTTVEISDDLMRRAKRKAADERVPLRDIVEAALRSYLADARDRQTYRLKWRTEHGELMPGVDIFDRSALIDVMEGRE